MEDIQLDSHGRRKAVQPGFVLMLCFGIGLAVTVVSARPKPFGASNAIGAASAPSHRGPYVFGAFTVLVGV